MPPRSVVVSERPPARAHTIKCERLLRPTCDSGARGCSHGSWGCSIPQQRQGCAANQVCTNLTQCWRAIHSAGIIYILAHAVLHVPHDHAGARLHCLPLLAP